jgi:hypothetical protein
MLDTFDIPADIDEYDLLSCEDKDALWSELAWQSDDLELNDDRLGSVYGELVA